ncbi:MAG: hypothetical protein IK024_11285 [Treponema sp.]|nr:hypothetical protein [Treponema sp.]
MKSVFKKIVLFTLCFSFAFVLFAEPKSTGITDSDVKNYAKNFDSIQKELDKLGVLTDDNNIQATAKQKADVDKILQKYGISGSNCIEKFGMISACAAVLVGESELDAESIALMKSFGLDPMAELKKYTNSKDFAVVQANSKAVVNAVKNADTSSYSGSSSSYDSASDDYSYSDAELADLYSRLGASAQDVASQTSDLSMNEINEQGKAVKKLYDQVSKAKGDSGFIYKSEVNASKYKKTDYKKGTVISIGDNEADEDIDIGASYIQWKFDLDKKKAELKFVWKDAVADRSNYVSGMKINSTDKTINYTITSVEYYFVKGATDRSYGDSMEYVIKTKEGPVFHFWIAWDGDYNAFRKKIAINGVSGLEDYFWTEE